MSSDTKPADSGKKDWIVTENGKRASGSMSHDEATSEANRRKKLAEGAGNPGSKPVDVKRNIMG